MHKKLKSSLRPTSAPSKTKFGTCGLCGGPLTTPRQGEQECHDDCSAPGGTNYMDPDRAEELRKDRFLARKDREAEELKEITAGSSEEVKW